MVSNPVMIMSIAADVSQRTEFASPRFLAAVAASLLLHVLILAGRERQQVDSIATQLRSISAELRAPKADPDDRTKTRYRRRTVGGVAPPTQTQHADGAAIDPNPISVAQPSAAPGFSVTPSIDIEGARQIARSGRSGTGNRMESGPSTAQIQESEPDSPLGKAIAKTTRPDCRVAHAGLGLFALPFLIADTITSEGCHW
jgi:hypothetical protein